MLRCSVRKKMLEKFFHGKKSALLTDEWKENPFRLNVEWYKIYMINDDTGLMECRITEDTDKSNKWDNDNKNHDYGTIGDFVYQSMHIEQI